MRWLLQPQRCWGMFYENVPDSQNVKTIICLYNFLVLSKLSFGSVIWNPRYAIYIDQLERIQRKFLKFISFRSFHESNAAKAQEYFHISPLTTKRTISDIMFLYKIVNNLIDSSELFP